MTSLTSRFSPDENTIIAHTQLELLGVRVLSGGVIGWMNKLYAGRIEGGGLLKIKEGYRTTYAMSGIALFDSEADVVKAVSSMGDADSPYEWR